jgi:hypothetical protein
MFALTVSAAVASMWTAPAAQADPLSGEVLKFQQLPMNNTNAYGQIYQGHDELSTAWLDPSGQFYRGTFMADDFADNYSSPVVHLRWWGSYIADPNQSGVQQFLITFESDVPALPGGFSQPGTPLLSQIVTPGALSTGSGTFTETLINGNVPEHLYQYNAELSVPFPEQKDTVYWLKIVALSQDTAMQWGWHNRDYTIMDPYASPLVIPGESNVGPATDPVWHFQDDAVTGLVDVYPNPAPSGIQVIQNNMQPTNYIDNIDGPTGISQYSKDLAFEVYTVPEPAVPALLGLVLTALVLRRPRRT